MDIKLTITGIDQAIRGVDKAQELLLKYVAEALDWFGKTVSEAAKEDHPYQDRTGELTRSIGYTVESWNGRTAQVNIFATASYAESVEFGTSKSRAYPFLFPQFYRFLDVLQVKLQDAVNRALTEGGVFGGAFDRRGMSAPGGGRFS